MFDSSLLPVLLYSGKQKNLENTVHFQKPVNQPCFCLDSRLTKHSGLTDNDIMSPVVSNKLNQEKDNVDSLVKGFVFCCS